MYPFSAFRFKVQSDHVDHIEIDDIKNFDTLVGRSRAQVRTVHIYRQSIDGTYISIERNKRTFFFRYSEISPRHSLEPNVSATENDIRLVEPITNE